MYTTFHVAHPRKSQASSKRLLLLHGMVDGKKLNIDDLKGTDEINAKSYSGMFHYWRMLF